MLDIATVAYIIVGLLIGLYFAGWQIEKSVYAQDAEDYFLLGIVGLGVAIFWPLSLAYFFAAIGRKLYRIVNRSGNYS